METNTHLGHNVRCLRKILEIKQSVIAEAIGMSQQQYSKLEQKQIIDDETLEKIAVAMNITVETIKNFSKEMAIYIFSNTLHDKSASVNHPAFVENGLWRELCDKLLKQIASLKTLLEKQ
ncbi:MAG: helix-turn-helix domain-containing protein [Prevotellaceae bacterium]|jgi:transcriptional regulator with XRE-family HTH domain|nr:helix-turn-helix domain-containing protein [Prevotellaceae bacterium]